MSPWTRHLLSLSLLLAVLAGARSQLFDSLAASWAALSEARQVSERERQREERLEQIAPDLKRRMAIKEAVVHQLIAGELPLREAAAWFKYVNERPTGCASNYRAIFRGTSAEESACRQVICWVKSELNVSSPSRAEEVVRRLEAELQGQLECDGKVELPDL
jgi:hypothetical protein